MIEIGHVLCPVDFSDFSRRALGHAAGIARWYGGTLTALHVLPSITSLMAPSPAGLYPPIVFTADDLLQFQRELEEFVASAISEAAGAEGSQSNASDLKVRSLVTEGGVASEIVRVANESAIDLLVMGTHGRSGFDRLILGSTTEKLLRKAPCPLLTIPRSSESAAPPPAGFPRILCAIDFGPASLHALAYAESLAKEADAELTLLHVVEGRAAHAADSSSASTVGGSEEEGAALERLRAAVSAETREFSRVSEVVRAGKPYEEILRTAAERKADLIVLGTHGGRFGLIAFGSTTNHVVRGADCPVLTVNAPR